MYNLECDSLVNLEHHLCLCPRVVRRQRDRNLSPTFGPRSLSLGESRTRLREPFGLDDRADADPLAVGTDQLGEQAGCGVFPRPRSPGLARLTSLHPQPLPVTAQCRLRHQQATNIRTHYYYRTGTATVVAFPLV
jgi:hypothetical protein